MGYSARYHAISLVAVFLALAIGILIGAEFGGDALNRHAQGPRAQPDRQPAGCARAGRRAERRAGALRRIRRAASIRRWSATGWRGGESAWSRSATCRATSPADRGGAWRRPGRAWSGVGVVREPVDLRALSARPRENPLRRHSAQRGDAGRLRHRRRAADRPRWHPARTRARSPLLARERQLRRARRRHRRPPTYPKRWAPCSAPTAETARSGADRRHHGDAHAGGRGRDLDRRTLLGLLLQRQRPLQRRRRRAARGPGGDGLRPARRRGQLRGQGLGRSPAAGPAAAGGADAEP